MFVVPGFLEQAMTEALAGRRFALCAVVATRGSTPQPPGVVVFVDANARMVGSLGGGCVESEIRRQARRLISASRSALLTFDLDHDFGYDDGMICGGAMDVAVCAYSSADQLGTVAAVVENLRAGREAALALRVEHDGVLREYRVTIQAAPEAVIAGGGHIARVLAGHLLSVGFRVSVIDERPEFADCGRFPPPINPVCRDIATALRDWPVRSNTYVVIVTRGHQHDEAALEAVADSPATYLGMIGSRRKIDVIFRDLSHRGVSAENLSRVHAPIGLDIGAVSAEEIALSIAAELVKVRRTGRPTLVEGPFVVGATPGGTDAGQS